MNTAYSTTTTVAPVKSPFLSKTNITAAVMALLGILTALGIVPAEDVSPETGGAVVAFGSGLVIAFRTFSKYVLRR